jgi:hypothetical protein
MLHLAGVCLVLNCTWRTSQPEQQQEAERVDCKNSSSTLLMRWLTGLQRHIKHTLDTVNSSPGKLAHPANPRSAECMMSREAPIRKPNGMS